MRFYTKHWDQANISIYRKHCPIFYHFLKTSPVKRNHAKISHHTWCRYLVWLAKSMCKTMEFLHWNGFAPTGATMEMDIQICEHFALSLFVVQKKNRRDISLYLTQLLHTIAENIFFVLILLCALCKGELVWCKKEDRIIAQQITEKVFKTERINKTKQEQTRRKTSLNAARFRNRFSFM